MQHKEKQVAQKPGVIRRVCRGCAIRHHDFREIEGRGMGNSQFSEVSSCEARIDGRRYRLARTTETERTVCSECGRVVPSIYKPIGEDEEDACMTNTVVISLARWARIRIGSDAIR